MPVSIPCPSCKARLKVPDGLIGRNKVIKCPGCAQPINLAKLKPAAKAEEAAPAPKPKKQAIIEEDEDVADDVDVVEDDEEPVRRRSKHDEDDEDEPRGKKKRSAQEEDSPKRRKKSKKKAQSNQKGLLLIGGIVLGVLVLVGGGIGLYFVFSKPKDSGREDGGSGGNGNASAAETRAIQAATRVGGEVITFPNDALSEQVLQFRFYEETHQLTDADLASLRPTLDAVPRGLGLNFNGVRGITDTGIGHLKGMTNLRVLWLDNRTQITPKCLESIETLTNLEDLSTGPGVSSDADLAQLAGLTKLRKVAIYNDKLTEAGLAPLSGLTEMRQFTICKELGDVGLGHIKGWTKLEKLELAGGYSDNGLSNSGMVQLKQFTNLRELRITHSNIDDSSLANLAGLSKIEKLEFIGCQKITEGGLNTFRSSHPQAKKVARYP